MSLDISRRLIRVWQRNFQVYKRTWKISFMPPLLEPVFYLLAFGMGLGAFVGKVPYEGREIPYIDFIAPAVVAVSIMQQAFFENTFASYVRMYYQKTFDAILATPLSIGDVIAGEIMWGATKSALAATLMTAAIAAFGIASLPSALLIIPLAFLGGLAFGSVGMIFTALVPTIEVFNLPIFLFITPMFLFSGTFFPIDGLPFYARAVALSLPLTHLADLARSCFFGAFKAQNLASLAYLGALAGVAFPLAVVLMRKRLVK